jgi:NAD-specific glutamate dehydrogenase
MELTDFLAYFSEALLVIALPILIAALIQWLRLLTARLRSQLDENQRSIIDHAVTTAVQTAEQVGVWEALKGHEKLARAAQIAQTFLDEKGIKIDAGRLTSLIETEVLRQFSNPTAPVDTAEERQTLIDSAVEAAVLAAEQSGLKGLIQNVGIEKKAYALHAATEYLNNHGIAVNEDLLGSLIEAQLLKLAIAARGESNRETT